MSEEKAQSRRLRDKDNFRRMSSEKVAKLKSIALKCVPNQLNDEAFMKQMFSQFGTVTRVYCNLAKQSTIIHFLDHETAANAKEHGLQLFSPDIGIGIFWSQSAASRKKERPERLWKAALQEKLKEVAVPSKSSAASYMDSEVAEELRSMGASQLYHHREEREREREREPKAPERDSRLQKKRSIKPKPVKEEPAPTQPKGDSRETLYKLIWSRAETSGEKYQVLTARDKILRQKRIVDTNLETAALLVGTCPDMCPEKERYMREDRKQLHPYEIDPNSSIVDQVDHRMAVKEYSRSSADQEEPLSHELRPISTLCLTMDHLVCNVMDKLNTGESNAAEWYDFLWNRTRAIRKDITQQHLCDLSTVGLVEKCARFHIHCAEYLADEDMSTFDQKINNENLTKCLQTLKHLYHDLRVKGVVCPCESEFRAYDVLLHLNDGDILREVQQLTPEVQSSDQVRFAINVFSALNSNNFVRFFKCVREGSYLNACILHRYFNQVRSKALHTISRSYFRTTRADVYSIERLVRILGFEDDQEAIQFCVNHGMSVENGQARLPRGYLVMVESVSYPKRAPRLMECKRDCSVGEIVNGGVLPINPSLSYKPHISFTPDGYLKDSAVDASDQLKNTVPDESVMAIAVPEVVDVDDSDTYSELCYDLQKEIHSDVLPELTKEIIFNEVDDTSLEIIHGTLVNELSYQSAIDDVAENICLETCEQMTRVVCCDALLEQHREEQTRILEERTRKLEEENRILEQYREEENRRLELVEMENERRIIEGLSESILSRLIEDELVQVSHETRRAVDRENFLQLKERCSYKIMDELEKDIVNIELQSLVENVFRTETERSKKVHEFEDKTRLKVLGPLFRHWRAVVLKSKRDKRSAEGFPAMPGFRSDSLRKSVKPDESSSNPVDVMLKRLKLTNILDFQWRHDGINRALQKLPLSVGLLVLPVLKSKCSPDKLTPTPPKSKKFYWKLVVSSPNVESVSPSVSSANETCGWIKRKLTLGNLNPSSAEGEETIALCTVEDSVDSKTRLSFCINWTTTTIRSVFPVTNERRRRFYGGTQALLFLLPVPSMCDLEFWSKERSRLQDLVSRCPFNPPLPLTILLIGDQSISEDFVSVCVERLGVENLLSANEIGSSHFDRLSTADNEAEAMLKLKDVVETLAWNCGPAPNLKGPLTLREFMEDLVSEYFTCPVFVNLKERRKLGLLDQHPRSLINMYNSVIKHGAKVVSSPSLSKVSWPITEFADSFSHAGLPKTNWNDPNHLAGLGDRVLDLTLPEFPITQHEDWESICELVDHLLKSILVRGVNPIILKARVSSVLDKTLRTFEAQTHDLTYVNNAEPSFENVAWTEIIHACAEYKLSCVDHVTSKVDLEAETVVYYLNEDKESFDFWDEWRKCQQLNRNQEVTTLTSTLRKAAQKRRKQEEEEEKKTRTKCKRRLGLGPGPEPSGKDTSGLSMAYELLDSIRKEKEETLKLENRIRKALSGSLDEEVLTAPRVEKRRIRQDPEKTSSFPLEDSIFYDDESSRLNRSNSLTVTQDLESRLRKLQTSIRSEKKQDEVFGRRLKLFTDSLEFDY